VDTFEDPITSDVLLALQLRTVNVPLLPRLKTFECEEATETFIPFIPLFLSPNTTEIHITSVRRSPIMVTAPMISRFSTLCPDLETITLNELPRDSVITAAVSEMLLACNRNALQEFQVDSPLTEDARGVVCQLPRLSSLWIVIQGSTPLPTLALPNLVDVDVEYDDYLYWLQGFHGARLEKLESACFRCYSKQIGDFLGEFERVALTTSAHNTLSSFRFCTSRSWNPNYSSLLSFKQLKELEIEFSCNGGCSSRVDDDVIISLARAMPKLEILQLGGAPCKIPTGVTVNGLICLAYRCSRLSKLRIHFQVTSLVRTATSAATESPSNDGTVVRRGNCALTNLEVGDIPIPVQSAFTVALILLQIFPRISDVEFTNGEWRTVAETIKHFRQIGAFVHRSGKAYHQIFNYPH